MALINKDDFGEATRLKKFRLGVLSSPLMKLLKIDAVNKAYDEASELEGVDFLKKILEGMDVNFEIDEKSLANIPESGPFITISNHPYGGIDGMILLRIIAEKRPDFKVMANFLLQKIKNIESFFLPVNPFDNINVNQSSLRGIKLTLEHLKAGNPVGIFPAGEVSSFQTDSRKVIDREWKPVVGKLIRKANVPVIPVYFSGNNSKLFSLLGMLHPSFRTLKLPSEMLNKKKNVVKVRIGKPIPPKIQEEFTDTDQLLKYLRAKTYALGSPLVVKTDFYRPRFINRKPEEIVPPVGIELLKKDVENLRQKGNLLFKQDEFECFAAYSMDIPNVIVEIGRLREITFREVGEGTNKNIDLDEFDLYYHHLFIWDRKNEMIVGAYRMGKGNNIYRKFRKKGFYIHTLFRIENGFVPILRKSIELGRSFIRKEYQTKHLSLFLLWRGILTFLQKNKYYRYLIGPVSISNSFSHVSKSLMVKFIMKHYFDHDLARYIKPRKKFRFDNSGEDLETLLAREKTDMKKLDELVNEIEPLGMRVPVLLKKYIKQDAKILGFNIDPKFGNALDGFMMMDFSKVPEETIKMLEKEKGREG